MRIGITLCNSLFQSTIYKISIWKNLDRQNVAIIAFNRLTFILAEKNLTFFEYVNWNLLVPSLLLLYSPTGFVLPGICISNTVQRTICASASNSFKQLPRIRWLKLVHRLVTITDYHFRTMIPPWASEVNKILSHSVIFSWKKLAHFLFNKIVYI